MLDDGISCAVHTVLALGSRREQDPQLDFVFFFLFDTVFYFSIFDALPLKLIRRYEQGGVSINCPCPLRTIDITILTPATDTQECTFHTSGTTR
jgi:hypothetical protein